MKIALCSTFVPFIYGGGRNIVEWLQSMLEQEGHHVERIYLPQVDTPDLLFRQMASYRWIDVSSADRIICFRPQSHLIDHPHKVLWFIHHLRFFYDLWETPYRSFPDDAKHRGIRDALYAADTAALLEAKKIFTNSRVVSSRLKAFNMIDSEVLYPPVFQPERFYSRGYNNEIVYICRMEHHKRQHLLVKAMQYSQTPVCLRLSGLSGDLRYLNSLQHLISDLDLKKRVILDHRWISEEEKVEYLADCLAAVYLPFDEDSYGYPSVEAGHASKPLLTTTDSGGVLELVSNGVNGYITEPDPKALAEAMDKLYMDRQNTRAMGKNALARLSDLNISWSHVLKRLLA